MRRPGIGVARRSGFRGIGSGAPASAAPYSWADLQAERGAAILVHSQAGIAGTPVNPWTEQWQGGSFIAGNAPAYSATSLDGKPGVTLNGTSNYLVDTSIASAGGSRTIYVVLDPTTAAAGNRILVALTAAGVGEIHLYQTDASGNVAFYDGAAIRSFGAAATTGPQLLTFVLESGVGATLYRDGVQIGTAACGVLDATDGCTIGRHASLGSQFAQCIVGAIPVYNAAHDAAERARVEAFLGATFLDA